MPKSCTMGLTKTKTGYCRTIGYHVNENNQRVPRKFRLGHDRALAHRKVQALEEAWTSLPSDRGTKVWTKEAIEQALKSLDQCPQLWTSQAGPTSTTSQPVPVFSPRPAPPPMPPRSYTLFEALDEFVTHFSARTDIGEKHREGTQSRIESIKNHLSEISVSDGSGGQIHLKDVSVAQIDMEWLARIRNKITSRPMSKHVYDTPKPISLDCVKNWLMTLAMCFDWLDRTPRIGWKAPHHRWRENFILSKKQTYALRTPAERDEEGKPKPAFTVDELANIYRTSTPMGRKYLLMGLMLGWSQEAISSFRRCHLIRIEEQYYIDRRRGKTGVEGYWWVCPELAQMLIKSMEDTPANQHDLAFLTEEGLPLVHGKTDSIRLAWERSLNGAPSSVRRRPFGRVKKCGAQIIENLGGHELAQLFLSHQRATVAAGHYTGTDVNVGIGKTGYERLHEVQKQMYEALKPVLLEPRMRIAGSGESKVA